MLLQYKRQTSGIFFSIYVCMVICMWEYVHACTMCTCTSVCCTRLPGLHICTHPLCHLFKILSAPLLMKASVMPSAGKASSSVDSSLVSLACACWRCCHSFAHLISTCWGCSLSTLSPMLLYMRHPSTMLQTDMLPKVCWRAGGRG